MEGSMSDPNNDSKRVSEESVTSDDLTVHPDAAQGEGEGASEEKFLPVGGPRSGDAEQGGTDESGISPEEEITPG
jgi:hypothetical protein